MTSGQIRQLRRALVRVGDRTLSPSSTSGQSRISARPAVNVNVQVREVMAAMTGVAGLNQPGDDTTTSSQLALSVHRHPSRSSRTVVDAAVPSMLQVTAPLVDIAPPVS
jgi:hypothetical protein